MEILLEDKNMNIGFIPIVKKGSMIDVADDSDKENILNKFEERSNSIANKDFIKNEWSAFCESRKYHYLYAFLGFGYLLRQLDRKLNHVFSNSLLNSRKLFTLYNFLFCEAHLDVQKAFLEQSYRKYQNNIPDTLPTLEWRKEYELKR